MKTVVSILMLLVAGGLQAQQVIGSTNYKISSKAAAGEWVDYCISPDDGSISMTFKTKESKKAKEFEAYHFSPDLSFKNMEEIELGPLESVAPCGGSERINLSKSQKATKALRVKRNLTSYQMVMELGTITYGYAGRALITTFNTEKKVKPKGDDGEKFLLIHSRTASDLALGSSLRSYFGQSRSDVQAVGTTFGVGKLSLNVGDVSAIVYQKGAKKFQEYGFVVYDAKTLNRKAFVPITLDKTYRALYARDMPNGDFGIIFAPITDVDITNKHADGLPLHPADHANFKYMRLNQKGEVVDEVDFELPKPKIGMPWGVTIIPADDPESKTVYFVGGGNGDILGMGIKEIGAAFNSMHNNEFKSAGQPKNNLVVLAKAGNGKLDYLQLHTPDALMSKAIPTNKNVKILSGKDAGKFFTWDNPRVIHATEMDGNDYLVCAGALNGYLFTLEMNARGDVQKMYLDHNKKTSYMDGALFKNSAGELCQVITRQPASESESEVQENNYKRDMVMAKIGGAAIQYTSVLPEKTFIDIVNPIRFTSEDEAIVLGHESRKDVTIAKVSFK